MTTDYIAAYILGDVVTAIGSILYEVDTVATVTLKLQRTDGSLIQTFINKVVTNFTGGIAKSFQSINGGTLVQWTSNENNEFEWKVLIDELPDLNVSAGFVVGPAIPNLKTPVILVLDQLDGTIKVTFSNNGGQNSRLLYQESGGALLTWGSTQTGDGDLILSGLDVEEDYLFVAQAVWNQYKGPLSNIQELTSKSSKVKNRDNRNHMSKFIQNLLIRSTLFDWYTKMTKASGIPTSQLNVPFIGQPVTVQYNENVRVANQAEIFQARGSIPMCIQRTGGYNKADLGFGTVRMGDFTAFCSIEHKVEIDDRLIDPVSDIEYRVVHSTPHKDGLYRHLELKWLR
jgi:hypothetical protein